MPKTVTIAKHTREGQGLTQVVAEHKRTLKPTLITPTAIQLTWSESELVDTTRTFKTWAEVDQHLRDCARTAPDTGSCHKTDFVITWSDGDTYKGMFDLKRNTAGEPHPLSRHVWEFVAFYAGCFQPAHLTRERYVEFVTREMTAEGRADYRAWLAGHDLPHGAGRDLTPVI